MGGLVEEVELKYRLDPSDQLRIRDALTRTGRFGSFNAALVGQTEHRDTYLDRDGGLRGLGWSLRIRESTDGTRITLKVARDSTGDGVAIERQEIENTSIADVNEVITEIASRLREVSLLTSDAKVTDVLSHGVFGSMDSLGLADLFSVRTNRTTWRLTDNGRHAAELVLDESRYAVGGTEELPEYQMEIELADRTSESTLDAIARKEYGLVATHETKFLRGLEFHRVTQLKEKVEAKLDLPGASAHAALVKMLRDNPDVIKGHHIGGKEVEQHITDVYYGTAALDLARDHCYLRIREEENGKRILYFRRVAAPDQGYLPTQEEFKGTDAEDDFATSWRMVASVVGKLLNRSPGDGSSGVVTGIKQLGLAPSLTARIRRLTWIVEPVDGGPSRRIAKIKVDDITFDDGKGQQRQHAEAEITGVEDHEAAPEYLDNEAFRVFMSLFRWACAEHVFRGDKTPELHVGTKYHTGLRLFGRLDDSAAIFSGGALIREESAWSNIEPRARSSLLWTVVFVVVSTLGLSALAGARSGVWQPVLFAVGVVLVLAACLLFSRDHSSIVSWRTRKRMVVAVATLALAIVVIRFGSKTAADLVGLIGFPLTVLGLLALNSRESSS